MKHTEANVISETPFPSINKDLRTRRIALCGLGFTYLFSILTFLSGVAVLIKDGSSQPYLASSSAATRELLPLFTSITVTFCIESIGYIHSSSLRWALLREERLELNSYLRLFTGTQKFGPNHWLTNLGVTVAIILTYMSTSAAYLPDFYTGSPNEYDGTGTRINGVALVTIGLGLAFQALVGSWTLKRHDREILSWSSNPLNTTVVCLTNGLVSRLPDRCLRGIDGPRDSSAPVQPKMQQVRAGAKIRSFGASLCFMLVVGIFYLILGASLMSIDTSDGFLDTPAVIGLGADGTGSTSPDNSSIFRYMLIVACCQTPLTIALHCAEIMVNLKRDEAVWRAATSSSGTRLASNGVLAAVKSPLTLYLFFFKAVLHWLFGQAVQVQYLNGLGFSGLTLLAMDIVYLILFFPFIFVARRHPRGAQPATYGHIQTIANLVDEWGPVMWWGDKGESGHGSGIRHAGTSTLGKLPDLMMDKLYQGL
jgi:hypothetical protein